MILETRAIQMTNKALLLFHTIKYLKFRQIFGRITHKLRPIKVNQSPAPALSVQTGQWVAPAAHSIRMLSQNQVRFLNVSAKINTTADWNSPKQTKLWLYNLHYFDDLNARNTKDRKQWHQSFIQKWIDENPIGSGNGWEAYPSSLRIINWIKWSLEESPLRQNWQHSLAIQTRYLCQQLEFHLLGNHLFVNAKALVYAGLYFNGKEADKWLQTGLSILKREIPEQILPDGGQFELSPMYHAIALEDILDLYNIASAFPERIPTPLQDLLFSLSSTAQPMLKWMQIMNHPDEKISFFNDSAFDIAPSTKELVAYAERLDITLSKIEEKEYIYLKNSGYLRVKKNNLTALLDVACIGPDYLPGHAHADTLSFELSAYNQRILVNSGTSTYGSDAERLRQRGTAAHNTVLINHENSSEVWGGFRVARRAKPFNLAINSTKKKLSIICSHNGYKRLEKKPVHQRQWLFKTNELLIRDTIIGSYTSAEANFHFSPDIKINSQTPYTEGIICIGGGKQLYWEILSGQAKLKTSTYHPEFGLSLENQCLSIQFQSAKTEIRFFIL